MSNERGHLFDVAGKTAVVTGGSRGIGAMLAEGLVDAGMRVVVAARRAEVVDSLAAQLAQRGQCWPVAADVTTVQGRAAIVDAVGTRFDGRLSLLVNNAGRTHSAPLADNDDSVWHDVLSLNVSAVAQLTAALLPALLAFASSADPARVINVGSVDGVRVPSYENYPYAASKAAVVMLTRQIATRVARDAVTVNCLAPGAFLSDMTVEMTGDPVVREKLERTIPLGRIGRPSDLVGATLFLASAAGAYVTGAVIPVDGGVTGCSPPR
jgi:NAD(P)-dependent dehydrogenase (short-subunit alcohol dehydrogenase family)